MFNKRMNDVNIINRIRPVKFEMSARVNHFHDEEELLRRTENKEKEWLL